MFPRRHGQLSTAEHLRQLLAAAIANGLLSGGVAALAALNSAIQTLAAGDTPDLAISLFESVRISGVIADDYTLTFAIKAVARLQVLPRGTELHSLSLKLGFGTNSQVQNSLISMYFSCRSPKSARKVFNEMTYRTMDVVSCNSMISGYVWSGKFQEAIKVFGEMFRGRSKVVPDVITFVGVLKACGGRCLLGTGRQLHAGTVVGGFGLGFFLGSSLIDMYSKCGRLGDARRVFDAMQERNVVCWGSMISGYLHGGQFKISLDLFREMQIAGVKPDEASVSSVLSACGQVGALCQGRWIHSLCAANGLEDCLKVKNALIDMYSKCGEMERALQVFHGMLHQRDVFSWTAIICGLAANGESAMALAYFSQMLASGKVSPNRITFLAVLSACSHGGFVEWGFRYFDEMISVHKIRPEIQHYGCMVDLLGRAKLLPEMELFIRKMPMPPDAIIWRSLIFACKNSGNVELAEAAAARIMELEETTGIGRHGSHISLSNLYASVERWKEVSSTRHGIVKKPGCSSIEINGAVFEFFVSSHHRDMDLIHEILLTMKE